MQELVLTARSNLVAKYGEGVIGALERILGRGAGGGPERQLLFIDDERYVRPLGVAPVRSIEPEAIKRLLDRLDASLDRRGELPVHYCILGGDDIVPFYRLPNPTLDGDEIVLSDNPYASRDDEFLVPERSLGRLPDGVLSGSGAGDPRRWLAVIEQSLGPVETRCPASTDRAEAFGCSASVWKDSSRVVFSVIGEPDDLRISPPLTRENFSPTWLAARRWLYFNLHGLPDRPGWYGQAAPDDPPEYPAYPCLIDPTQIGRASGAVIASEACYGANVVGEDHATSLALAFLDAGARGFVGSTATSYGPARPPPSEADLLVAGFLRWASAGMSLGQAFLRAKVEFAETMLERQGFLDADDRKTLLEFVLFADPIFVVSSD
ncbi:hypothetical protein AMJ39_04130 [candidate division TA06 bacterium DG_24]|jgi:hypothetical protein|uniref:Gingipain domain-containing protein n=3 Tax=Bacteria division TA06 TaxID=1156500 RepID=A0A0S8JAS3_UNCT6|nr:MAG: hypothetical protein AMJ39_04130 [candidate division TA06 bacterium DG_24]KPK70569.1 MAG: hypothetical protein AMJ82_02900 [candidate division TA06 bacterium SM23_40]KPL06434.1 MAG: hypothetical protein AMJ71_09715 [candidate division TA06 bacterium SM1_40]